MVSWQGSRAACRLAHRIAPGLGASLGGAGRGATPHGIASDGSPPGPSGLSPAVAVGRAVACGPTRSSSGGGGATPSRMAPVAAPGPPASDVAPDSARS